MIVCKDCSEEFEFTAQEQEFYASKGFGEPIRCKPCRIKKKLNYNSPGRNGN